MVWGIWEKVLVGYAQASVWRRLGHDGQRQKHRQDAVAEVQAGAYSAVNIEEVLLWAGRHLMEA